MDRKRYKKFVALQVLGLILLLCGQWPLAMVLFVVGHIMSVRPQKEQVRETVVERQRVEAAIQTDSADFWKDEFNTTMPVPEKPVIEEPVAKKPAPKKPAPKRRKPKADPFKGLNSVISTLTEEGFNSSKYPPNAFVIRGAQDKLMLCDYDDEGLPTDKGIELGSSGIASVNGPVQVDCSSFVLVHVVKGSEESLVKALQVHRVNRKGKAVSISELAGDGILLDVARFMRVSYMEEVS